MPSGDSGRSSGTTCVTENDLQEQGVNTALLQEPD